MYSVDNQDIVTELYALPESSPGAPCPLVLSDEHTVVVAYYVPYEDGCNDEVAIVTFRRCQSILFGPPNDEAFRGHPLYSKGLRPYRNFKVEDSSWIRKLCDMNSVHPYHKPELFEDYKHIILAFHDSVFECICKGYEYEIQEGTIMDCLELMKEKLE